MWVGSGRWVRLVAIVILLISYPGLANAVSWEKATCIERATKAVMAHIKDKKAIWPTRMEVSATEAIIFDKRNNEQVYQLAGKSKLPKPDDNLDMYTFVDKNEDVIVVIMDMGKGGSLEWVIPKTKEEYIK